MSYQITFQELKQKVGIDDVAYSLGYRLNRRAGVGRYIELVLPDGTGGKLDTIVISHPREKERQRYFQRNSGHRGDVVDFVGEHLSQFNKFGRNQWEVITKVLADFANMPVMDYENRRYSNPLGAVSQTFNPKRYVADPISRNMDFVKGMFADRGIAEDTVSLFSKHISVVRDEKYKGNLPMIGFPYREPGFEKDILGYELRGDRGYKGKAAGTNSSTAMWVAGIPSALNNPDMVRDVYFAESAYDAMAFYQTNKARIDLAHSAFVSLGGTFSNGQVNGVMRHFKMADAVDCFDNDLAGRIYGMRMAALVDGKDISIIQKGNELLVQMDNKEIRMPVDKACLKELSKNVALSGRTISWKPPASYKDWNDVVMEMPTEALKLKTKFQRDEHLAHIREEMRERKARHRGFRM